MASITQKQLKEYQQFCKDRATGRVLTCDGLKLICDANGNDPEKIGRHILECLARINRGKSSN